MCLDRDAAFLLKVHLIQDLITLVLQDKAGSLKKTVGERGFAVIDMGNDTEVPYAFRVHDSSLFCWHRLSQCRLEDHLLAVARHDDGIAVLELTFQDPV